MRRLRAKIVAFALACAPPVAMPAWAQQSEEPEDIEIGLSTDEVAITSGFAGTNLTIFGALDNPDPLISRQGRYDVVVVLEGPDRPVVVRKKTRVLGVWINTQSETFTNVPASYAVAMTRMPQDITTDDRYRALSLGVDFLRTRPLDEDQPPQRIKEFSAALRDRMRAAGLYTVRVGGVQFLSQSLFRATLALSPNVPVGGHTAHAYLFRNGVFVHQTSAPLTIKKAGLEQGVYETAHNNSLLYGLAAVAIAVFTGWLGRVLFRRD